jgi:cysteine desulfurase
MKLPIYLDYSSTCPIDKRVMTKMMDCMKSYFGNPSSRSHSYGWQAEEMIDIAREQIATLINADYREIVFTSGATESNNLAIKGAAHFYGKTKKHIITSQIEHKAVLDTCRQLERENYEVTYIKPEKNGLINLKKLKEHIRNDTILVSIMHVNNEIGTIQDIAAIGNVCRSKKIILHVDAAQSIGKLPIDVHDMKIDLLSISAHKIYGPKGIGALYICRKPRVRLEAQIHGGGHERGFRSGTLATHQIVGLGEACKIAKEEMQHDFNHAKKLNKLLLDGLKDLEAITINGDLKQRLPYNLNISFAFIEGESLLMSLKDIAVSSGSACTSVSLEPSYVLRALGLEDELAHSSIRFSFGRYTTKEEINYAADKMIVAVKRLREMSPLYEMVKEGVDLSTVEWSSHRSKKFNF